MAASLAARMMMKTVKTCPETPPATKCSKATKFKRGGVQNELDAEENADRVAAGHHREKAEPEENGGDGEVVDERNVRHLSASPSRA